MPSTSTITSFNTFAAATVIQSAKMNSNFDALRGHIIPVDPTASAAGATQTWDLGSQEYRWRKVHGKISPRIDSTSGSMTIGVNNDLVYFNTTANTLTATLPAIANTTGTVYSFVNIGTANTLFLDGNGSETIDGTVTLNLVFGESISIVSDGSSWRSINYYPIPLPSTSGNVLTSNGSKWVSQANSAALDASYEISNLSLATSVGGSALTIALKDKAGSDPSAGSPVKVGFRNSTLTTGTYNQRSITSALSLVVSSGSTLGQTSTKAWTQWIYLIDNAGTPELAISGSLYNENQLISTTAEGGAGAADSITVIYSTTARSNVPFRLIGKLINTQTTAGTWASAGTQLQVGDFGSLTNGGDATVQTFTSGSGTYYTPSGCIRIRLRMVGGGGGGYGVTTGVAYFDGSDGGDTTFGSLTADHGDKASVATGGSGGAGSANIRIPGGSGCGGGAATNYVVQGGDGGNSYFGGGGGGGTATLNGKNAATNSGSGGSGAGGSASYVPMGGGGAGEYVEHIFNNPASSYSYAVGAGGAGGAGATVVGGNGAAGIIIVEEFYK